MATVQVVVRLAVPEGIPSETFHIRVSVKSASADSLSRPLRRGDVDGADGTAAALAVATQADSEPSPPPPPPRLVDNISKQVPVSTSLSSSNALALLGKVDGDGRSVPNRNGTFNHVFFSNSTKWSIWASVDRTKEVVLALPVRSADLNYIDALIARLDIYSGAASVGKSGMIQLGHASCKLSALVGDANQLTREVSLPISWSPDLPQSFNPNTGHVPRGHLQLVALSNQAWKQVGEHVVHRHLGPYLHYPVVRSFVFGDSRQVMRHQQHLQPPDSTWADNLILASELAYESRLSFDIPNQYLRLRLMQLVEKVQHWEKLYSAVRIANCRFDSPHLAARAGYQQVRLAIVGASNLLQVQAASQTVFGKEKARFSNFLQSAQKTLDGSSLGTSNAPTSSGKLCSPFVRLSFQHPSGHRVVVGRTKTEQRTDNPRFSGVLSESEHAATVRMATSGAMGFEFFVPCNPDVLVVLEVFHDRREGITQKVVHVPMMQACLPMHALLARKREGAHLERFTNVEMRSFGGGPKGILGTLQIDLDTNLLRQPELFNLEQPSEIPENAVLFQWQLSWMQKHVERLHTDISMLNKLLATVQALDERLVTSEDFQSSLELPTCLKRSTEKKDFDVGAIATNLHVEYFLLETVVQSKERLALLNEAANVNGSRDHLQRRSSSGEVSSGHAQLSTTDASVGQEKLRRKTLAVPPSRPPPPRKTSGVSAAQPVTRAAETKGESFRRPPPPPAPQRLETSSRGAFKSPPVRAPPSRRSAVTSSARPLAGSPLVGVFPITTCGAPAAHCFGFGNSKTLLPLRQKLNDCEKNAAASAVSWSPWLPEFLPSRNIDRHDTESLLEMWQQHAVVAQEHFMRETVVLSQALSSLLSCFVSELALRLTPSKADHLSHWNYNNGPNSAAAWFRQVFSVGFLVGWESLVSAQGKELGMLEDSIQGLKAVEATCRVFLERKPDPLPGAPQDKNFRVTVHTSTKSLAPGSDAMIHVRVALSNEEYGSVCNAGISREAMGAGIKMVPLLFTQGINETQTLANFSSMISETSGNARQTELNVSSMQRLCAYAKSYFSLEHSQESGAASQIQPGAVARALDHLQKAVEMSKTSQKDIQVLLFAQRAVRLLNGGRITFCKSGKDRTAMSVTLEQTRLVHEMPPYVRQCGIDVSFGEDHADELYVSNLFREYGNRIVVAEKNVGRPKYSFNAAQRQLLPALYRPPTSTIQDFYTSVKARDS